MGDRDRKIVKLIPELALLLLTIFIETL